MAEQPPKLAPPPNYRGSHAGPTRPAAAVLEEVIRALATLETSADRKQAEHDLYSDNLSRQCVAAQRDVYREAAAMLRHALGLPPREASDG